VPRTRGLSEIAMSLPVGTLTDEYRKEVLDFYGGLFDWTEIEQLRAPDQMTLHVGRRCFVNLRERESAMEYHGYEHVGMLVESTESADAAWEQVRADERDLELQPMEQGDDGYRSFRFRYLLPLAVEVQFIPREQS
jgi:hypothetical protein